MPERAGHGIRDPTDYYATTPALATLVCGAIRRDFGLVDPRTILEPGCGAGTFMRAIDATWPRAQVLHGIEIHDDLAEYAKAQGFDVEFADVLNTHLGEYDIVIGNPPFRYSDAFIPLLLRHMRPDGVLAFILRVNYLAGKDRFARLWSQSPPKRIYALPARPGFTRDGKTDATDYCVVVWLNGYVGPTTFEWIDNRDVMNKWDRPGEYPDPRRVLRPRRETLAPRVTLAEWQATVPAEQGVAP